MSTTHKYQQGRVSLGSTPIGNRPVYGTTARCSCGDWTYRTNESPTGKGARYCREAHAAHVDKVAGPVVKAGNGWEWTPPAGETRRYRTKYLAIAARDQGPGQ
jgi:hypothetical protein